MADRVARFPCRRGAVATIDCKNRALYRAMTHRHPLLLLASVLVLATGSAAHAEKTDRDQPMHIEADSLVRDDAKLTSVFTGNVVITKGSIVLRGARVQVQEDGQGHQSGIVTAAPGQRAYFRQKRDTPKGAPEEFIEGEAETIDWDGRTELVKLKQRAELRRLRAGVLSDDISGALITYNNATDIFTVDGAPRKPGQTGAGGDQRVRATLAPKEKPAQPGAPTAETPALRASPELAPAPRQAP